MSGKCKTNKNTSEGDKAQLDRFKQTARELGCDETGEAFEKAFAKAVPARHPQMPEEADQGEEGRTADEPVR